MPEKGKQETKSQSVVEKVIRSGSKSPVKSGGTPKGPTGQSTPKKS